MNEIDRLWEKYSVVYSLDKRIYITNNEKKLMKKPFFRQAMTEALEKQRELDILIMSVELYGEVSDSKIESIVNIIRTNKLKEQK